MTTHQPPSKAVKGLPRVDEFLSSIPMSRTAQTYRYMLGSFAIFLSSTKMNPEKVDSWTDDLVAKFYEWMIRKEYQDATITCGMASLKRYLVWLEAHDLLPFRLDKAMNRFLAIRSKGHYGIRHADPEMPKIVTYYDSLELPKDHIKRLKILRARAVVHTLYASAGRASEISSLTRDMLQDGHLSECNIIGKGKKERILLLTYEAQHAIQEYCAERDDNCSGLFISHGRNKGKPIGRGTIWSIVKHAAKEIGLKGFSSPHAFRHYRAQQLLDGGMDLETLQSMLGHTDINLTRKVYAPKTPLAKLRRQLDAYGLSPQEALGK